MAFDADLVLSTLEQASLLPALKMLEAEASRAVSLAEAMNVFVPVTFNHEGPKLISVPVQTQAKVLLLLSAFVSQGAPAAVFDSTGELASNLWANQLLLAPLCSKLVEALLIQTGQELLLAESNGKLPLGGSQAHAGVLSRTNLQGVLLGYVCGVVGLCRVSKASFSRAKRACEFMQPWMLMAPNRLQACTMTTRSQKWLLGCSPRRQVASLCRYKDISQLWWRHTAAQMTRYGHSCSVERQRKRSWPSCKLQREMLCPSLIGERSCASTCSFPACTQPRLQLPPLMSWPLR